jgi:DUF4097 and DUF4098 domain-containing protein YvlB
VSDSNIFPAGGISHLIIEQMARDAMLEGSSGAALPESEPGLIEVTCQSTEGGGAIFGVEGATARLSGAVPLRVIVPPGTIVTVKSAWGDLRVQKLIEDVNLESVRGSLRLSELSGVIRVAQVDADLRAQGVADLRLMGNCSGDLRFENGEHLAAESVAGDVRIHDLDEARLGRVRGDLWAESVRGALQVTRAEGDARLTEIGGPVTLRAIAGDLRANALTGGLSAPQVSGDVVLQGPFSAVEPYSLSADGDVVLNLPGDADVRVTASAAGRIRSDVPLAPVAGGSAAFTTTLGRGAADISLVCLGNLRIVKAGEREPGRRRSKTPPDLRDLSEHIRQQVSASLAAAGISVTGDAGWDPARQRPRPPKEPKPPRPPAAERRRAPSATREEQVAVLKMVEEGKITAEEAELLLNALGG